MSRQRATRYESQVEAALRASRQACLSLSRAFHRGFEKHIDEEIDQTISESLMSEFPSYGYRSEELGLKAKPKDEEKHSWVVDPQDGTAAADRGFRGAAVSIALLRNGIPVLGVVYAYCAPDDNGDCIWWAEGFPQVFRNGKAVSRSWPEEGSGANTVLLSQDADRKARVNAELVAPMRYHAVPGIAYRLALAAVGDGDVGVSLNRPAGWDMAGGHALLIGAGGNLYNASGEPVAYDETGTITTSSTSAYFGGHRILVEALLRREWKQVFKRAQTSAADDLCYLVPGKTVPDANLLARAQGCMLGQLAGDALGSLVEFQKAAEIKRRYPEGPCLLDDGGTWSTIAGQPTDDSELALTLARSIVAAGDYDPDKAAAAYAKWRDSDPFDMGSTTARALSAASRAAHNGESPAAAASAAANRDSEANGALMRISPLGIFGAAFDPVRTFNLGRKDASLTHPHSVCRDASGVMAAALSQAIQKGCAARELYDFALQLAEDQEVVEPVKKALRDAAKNPPQEFSIKEGWVLIALQNAFFQLLHAESLEAGIIATVRHGGDTDTNAAIAGSLLGAIHGRGAIPAQWMNRVITCRPLDDFPPVKRPRPAEYWPVDALALAERLLLAGMEMSKK